MVTRRTHQVRIPLGDFADDIRQGMTDQDLMAKYGIARQSTLLTAFDRLVESGLVTSEELNNRSPFINTQAIVDFLGNTRSVEEQE
jgi:hypothetical protein